MSAYHIGFTGTREGLTQEQQEALTEVLGNMCAKRGWCILHHGDCIGADEDAHDIATGLHPMSTHIHPPSDGSKRAHCVGGRESKPRPYMKRNADIVKASSCLIACPLGAEGDHKRSGTWATVRMARRAGKHILIIYPDGKRNVESW